MDGNCAGNRFLYYKDPISCQPNLTYSSEPYKTAYPQTQIDNDIKDHRRLYPTGSLYYHHHHHPPPPQPTTATTGTNYKSDIDYHNEKTITPKTPYSNYGVGTATATATALPFKESNYYPYYDQYKYNIGSTNNFSQFSKSVNYQNFQTNPFQNSPNVAPPTPSNFCEDSALALKSLATKTTVNTNLAPYNYSNYYGYSTAAAPPPAPSHSTTFPSQNFCGYNYNEESRLLWEDYQNNRRVQAAAAAQLHPLPVSSSYPTNVNHSIKESTNADLYRTNHYPYHTETLPIRDTTGCSTDFRSHRRTSNSSGGNSGSNNTNNNHYNNRSIWSAAVPAPPPPHHPSHAFHFQYSSVPQNIVNPATYDRINYHHTAESQAAGCCLIRHDKPSQRPLQPAPPVPPPSDVYQNYKYLSAQHIPPAYRTAETTGDLYNPYASAALYNDRINYSTASQNHQQQQQEQQHQVNGTHHFPHQNCYKVEPDDVEMEKPNVCNPLTEINSNVIEGNYVEDLRLYSDKVNVDNNYIVSTQANTIYNSAVVSSNINNAVNNNVKQQNLREFLSSWNEDEDDGIEKFDANLDSNSDEIFLDSTQQQQQQRQQQQQQATLPSEIKNNNITTTTMLEKETLSIPLDNQIHQQQQQYNGQFIKSRPKIHVGITVDSNVVTNDQFINLPDIIIDIEKSKDVENHTTQIEDKKLNGGNVVLYEPIDVSITDFERSYKERNDVIETNRLNRIQLNKSDKNESQHIANCKIKRWLKIRTRSANCCKIKKINRKIIHKHCCKSNVKRKKIISRKRRSIKTGSSRSSSSSSSSNSSSSSSGGSSKMKTSPKSLKCICVSVINTEKFREFMIENYKNKSDEQNIESPTMQSATPLPEPPPLELLPHEPQLESDVTIIANNTSDDCYTESLVPKLSALCENALNDFYEKGLLVINVEENEEEEIIVETEELIENNRLYVLECDINETELLTSPSETISLDFIEYHSNDPVIEGNNNDTDNNKNIYSPNYIINNNDENSIQDGQQQLEELQQQQESLLEEETIKDNINSIIHHEEIVPENYKIFESKKFIKYLHNKYVQRNRNFLQKFVINKILSKYKKPKFIRSHCRIENNKLISNDNNFIVARTKEENRGSNSSSSSSKSLKIRVPENL